MIQYRHPTQDPIDDNPPLLFPVLNNNTTTVFFGQAMVFDSTTITVDTPTAFITGTEVAYQYNFTNAATLCTGTGDVSAGVVFSRPQLYPSPVASVGSGTTVLNVYSGVHPSVWATTDRASGATEWRDYLYVLPSGADGSCLATSAHLTAYTYLGRVLEAKSLAGAATSTIKAWIGPLP